MPWSETTPMDQKTQFIADYLRQTLDMTELCQMWHQPQDWLQMDQALP